LVSKTLTAPSKQQHLPVSQCSNAPSRAPNDKSSLGAFFFIAIDFYNYL
jgi:hypothetical protein